MADIETLRREFDIIDQQILDLLEQRLILSQKIGNVKKRQNLPVYAQKREREIFQKIAKRASSEHSDNIARIYQTIFTESKKVQQSND